MQALLVSLIWTSLKIPSNSVDYASMEKTEKQGRLSQNSSWQIWLFESIYTHFKIARHASRLQRQYVDRYKPATRILGLKNTFSIQNSERSSSSGEKKSQDCKEVFEGWKI